MRLLGLFISILGSICVAQFIFPLANGIAVPLLVISLALFVASFYYHHVSVWLWIALCGYSWASHVIHHQSIMSQPVTCQAMIQLMDFPKLASPTGEKVRAKIIASDDCPLENKAVISIRAYQTPNWRLSEIIDAKLKFLPMPRQFLGKANIAAYANLVAVTAKYDAPPFNIHTWRSNLSTLIDERYSARTQRWWQALLIGNRHVLAEQDWQLLRRTGTAHLLAISGLHLAIIASMAFWLIQILWAQSRAISTRVEPRSAALIGALLVALIYSLISGAQPPVMRAWIMFAVYALHWFYIPLRSGLQALLLTAIILLINDVYLIFSVSAWLSFYATMIVILSYRRYKHYGALRLWMTLQAIITIALWPLVWALFGGISLLSYLVNLIIVPWIGVILMVGYLGLLIPGLAGFSDALLVHYLNTIRFFANMDFAYLTLNWQPTLLTASCFCLAVMLWLIKEKRVSKYGKYGGLLLVLLGCGSTIFSIYPKNAYTIFQQKPLLAVISYDKHTYVINAGYRSRGSNQAQSKLLTYLRQHALTPEALILTATNKRATTALSTLIEHYPEMKLYSVVLTRNIPFEVKYCPQNTSYPLVFIKARYCEAWIGNQWRIGR